MTAEGERDRNTTNGLLLAQGHEDRRRLSISSLRSESSVHTILEDNPNNRETTGKLKRRQTERVRVRIPSRLACLWGFLFGTERLERMCYAEIDPPDDKTIEEDCPFTPIITVISRLGDRRRINERCAFDTMSLLGNIVSLKFANCLGYNESDFKKLRPMEESGKSSSGHIISPKGAIYLSWYHSTSPQYSNMRFLVVEDYPFDLLIGARSIYHHNMMSPPVFVQTNGASHTKTGDKVHQKLLADLKKFKDRRDKLMKASKARSNNQVIKDKWQKTIKLVELKELQIEEQKAHNNVKKDPKDLDKQQILKDKQDEIKQFEKDHGSENDLDIEYVAPTSPNITLLVEEPNGTQRSPTGLTRRSTGQSVTSKGLSFIAKGVRK